jgi:peptidoglycan/LPS O-acetylase OafA/YrhL
MNVLVGFKNKLFSDEFAIPDFLSQKYIPSLDGLRALSILVVIVAHVNTKFSNLIVRHIVNGGLLGVHVFFVISGFLITSLLIREKVGNKRLQIESPYQIFELKNQPSF